MNGINTFTLAAAQFPVCFFENWAAFETLVREWAGDAARRGAKLLVFPEYAAMALASLLPQAQRSDLRGQLAALQPFAEPYRELHSRLARELGVWLLAGSFPWRCADGRIVNRAWFCAPSGQASYQDKCIMTRFEREQWGVTPGAALRVFDTALGCIGIDICYDVEFPLLARAQAEAGATLILAPSCTDTVQGYWRVRIGAQARALENQCVVVQAPLVGEAPWSPAVDVNRGAAGVFGPPDTGFPESGVLGLGQFDRPQWLLTELSLGRVEKVRRRGQVLNFRHWQDQHASPALLPPERIALH